MIDISSRIKRYSETGVSLIQEVQALNPLLVLDLGCGENLYKQFFPNIIGVDINSESQCDIIAPIENLSFQDNYADVAFCFGVFSSSQVSAAVAEVKRVIKPNGLIFIRDVLDVESALESARVSNDIPYDRTPVYINKVTDPSQIRLFWVWRNTK